MYFEKYLRIKKKYLELKNKIKNKNQNGGKKLVPISCEMYMNHVICKVQKDSNLYIMCSNRHRLMYNINNEDRYRGILHSDTNRYRYYAISNSKPTEVKYDKGMDPEAIYLCLDKKIDTNKTVELKIEPKTKGELMDIIEQNWKLYIEILYHNFDSYIDTYKNNKKQKYSKDFYYNKEQILDAIYRKNLYKIKIGENIDLDSLIKNFDDMEIDIFKNNVLLQKTINKIWENAVTNKELLQQYYLFDITKNDPISNQYYIISKLQNHNILSRKYTEYRINNDGNCWLRACFSILLYKLIEMNKWEIFISKLINGINRHKKSQVGNIDLLHNRITTIINHLNTQFIMMNPENSIHDNFFKVIKKINFKIVDILIALMIKYFMNVYHIIDIGTVANVGCKSEDSVLYFNYFLRCINFTEIEYIGFWDRNKQERKFYPISHLKLAAYIDSNKYKEENYANIMVIYSGAHYNVIIEDK